MLVHHERLVLTMDVEAWRATVAQIDGTRFAPVDADIAAKSAALPGTFHKSPADRTIVAAAQRLGPPLVTRDEKIRAYTHIKTLGNPSPRLQPGPAPLTIHTSPTSGDAMPYASLATGVLLAAGLGQRFDPSGTRSKLLALLPDGTPVAVAAARRLAAATVGVIAVVRPGAEKLAILLNEAGCQVVYAPDAVRGMGASLAAGVSASPDANSWLVALADMPWIAASTYEAVARALDADGASIVAPVHRGLRGHPVGFAERHYDALAALDGDTGARALFAREPVTLLDVDDPGILRDVDTPADLARGRNPR